MLNVVCLQGRLGADPELRHTQSGKAVATVNIAVDREYKSQDGTRETDWIPIVAWGASADFLCKYFTKGRSLIVKGRLQVRKWTDQNGNKRTSTEVIAESLSFGDSKRDGSGSYAPPSDYDAPPDYAQPGEFTDMGANEADLPF